MCQNTTNETRLKAPTQLINLKDGIQETQGFFSKNNGSHYRKQERSKSRNPQIGGHSLA
jgi:hypothetical protein